MEAYTTFAEVYDDFMDNIPYDEWSEYICQLLEEHGINEGILLELGCGTGSITRRLDSRGFDMIGIDNSCEMLSIAMSKTDSEQQKILYLNQDMCEFELHGTIDATISVCDSINYIVEYEDLVQTFRLVNHYLEPKGVFIFDLKTYKYFSELGDCTIAENREDASFIWENAFYEDDCINEYELTMFVREQTSDCYRKSAEMHYQRAYKLEEIKRAIEEAGLEWVAAYDAFTHNPVSEACDRIYVIARQKGKQIDL